MSMLEARGSNADAAYDEGVAVFGEGRILKARFPNNAYLPNTMLFEVPIGNCRVCRFANTVTERGCLNPNIEPYDYQTYWSERSDCPEYEPGVHPQAAQENEYSAHLRDAMRAAGLAPGTPEQPTQILQNLAWTPDRDRAAHAQKLELNRRGFILGSGHYDPEDSGFDPDDALPDIP